MNPITQAHRVINRHSKSFAFALRLLPAHRRDDVAMLYAWCRYVDDAVDLAPPHRQQQALAKLRRELTMVYGTTTLTSPVLGGFQQVVRRRRIPRGYPEALVEGMAMDVSGTRYRDLEHLLLYCYRVAGVVGLMMCHVLGVRDAVGARALHHAAHLGIAMQLTNICRDVAEDWERNRLYIPGHGAGRSRRTGAGRQGGRSSPRRGPGRPGPGGTGAPAPGRRLLP